MDSSGLNRFDIFEIYRRYCEITSGAYACGKDGYRPDDDSQKAVLSREALSQLLKAAESRVHTSTSIFEEVSELMSRLDLMVDSYEFSRFYNFVFFVCREKGQKSIPVTTAISAWRLVLSGRFRLLNQWCDFIEKNQRYNISEDTWRQVLAFSRCVHENLEGYDPEGAWPVLIDDFVEHMYRLMGSGDAPNVFCNCGDVEAPSNDDSLPGLKIIPGVKRKLGEDVQEQDFENSDVMDFKRRHTAFSDKFMYWGENSSGNSANDCMENIKQNSPMGCSVEGCLSRGFAGLFSSRSNLQFDRERRVSYT